MPSRPGAVALPARVVVAGTHSGVGKTSVATGLAAALVAAGHRVATAKVGPDFIDPGYHAVATGRPGRNLDAWMSGAGAVPALAERAAGDADLLVVEGVMGLFDGAASAVPGAVDAERDDASTAHVARLLDAPVVLVVDAASMSRSVAALVHGFAGFDRQVRVAGVILNRVGSDGHERLLRDALEPAGLPVLGALRRDDAFAWRDRHLGLVPVVEQRAEVAASVARLAAAVAAGCDLEAVVRLARSAPERVDGDPLRAARRVAGADGRPGAPASGPGPVDGDGSPDRDPGGDDAPAHGRAGAGHDYEADPAGGGGRSEGGGDEDARPGGRRAARAANVALGLAGQAATAAVTAAATAATTALGIAAEAVEAAEAARRGPLRIAVAGGPAFSFSYPDNVERLAETGAEVVPFDPLTDAALPAGVGGLVVGGGFPEVFGAALADNRPLLADVARRVSGGLVTWAECGGLLWLARSLDGHAMAGVIEADGVMTDRLSLGYRTAESLVGSPLGPAGTRLRGHEFHYSTLDPAGDALRLEGRFGRGVAGHASPTLLASYLHIHLGADPTPAEHLVETCLRSAARA